MAKNIENLKAANADMAAKTSKDKETGSAVQPCAAKEKKIISIDWVKKEAWCSELAPIRGHTENYSDGEKLSIEVKQDPPKSVDITKVEVNVNGNRFSTNWKPVDILPSENKGHYIETTTLSASVARIKTRQPISFRFIPNLKNKPYQKNRAHFELEATDYQVTIKSDIKFVKGWGAEVVKLGNHVPNDEGGLLDGRFAWNGYRWMKREGVKRKYWNGSEWKETPSSLDLDDPENDNKHFCVGFYKNSSGYISQYGGTWPGTFEDWDINSEPFSSKVKKWEKNIIDTWSDKFKLKRVECESKEDTCCRYKIKTQVCFLEETSFSTEYIIIAAGNIRSNDALFFIDEPRIAMAAHEFGHHIGNPDEYFGAEVDTSLNADGAVNGIDEDSIMGQNLSKVKKRHYRQVREHFQKMVKTQYGKNYTYKIV